jgi:hypothetical protein
MGKKTPSAKILPEILFGFAIQQNKPPCQQIRGIIQQIVGGFL